MRWSVSQSHMWTACPLQWWMAHVVKVPAAQYDTTPKVVGRATHAGLEVAYGRAAKLKSPAPPRARMAAFGEWALAAFDERWQREAVAARVMPRDHDEAVGNLLETLDVLPVPAPGSVLGVEVRCALELPDGATAVCVVDLALATGRDSVHVRDWKSGKVPAKPADIESNLQLGAETAAIRVLDPGAKTVTAGLYSTRERREVSRELAPESVDFAIQRLNFDSCQAADALEAPGTAAERFPATPGDHCTGCVFRSYCPVWQKVSLPVRPNVNVDEIRPKVARQLEQSNRTHSN